MKRFARYKKPATDGRLAGKVALVTGGSGGQGQAEARLFAQEGAAVVLVGNIGVAVGSK